MKEITQSELKRILDYCPDIGVFSWITKPCKNMDVSSIAGYRCRRGYIKIQHNNKEYLAHRLAWLFVYGYFPEHGIDHINRNPSDNRIKNLREVSQQCNLRNAKLRKDNKSGVRGVCWSTKAQKWVAQIKNMGQFSLGGFKDFDEAVCHRLAAEQSLNWRGCDSSSPAYKYVKENIQN